ncbi:MAG: hypothetical protein AB7N76_02030 [Planctomycetota bacterium]
MASFTPKVESNAGDPERARQELRAALRELGLQPTEDADGNIRVEFQTGSYDPMPLRFWCPEGMGVVAIEGEVLLLEGEPADEMDAAINYLNVALDTCRFYLSAEVVCVRADMLPSVGTKMWIHPKELRHVLTDLCTQRAMFSEALGRVQGGRPWTAVKDALRAYR